MKVSTPLLAPLFRSEVQGKLLAALFADPEKEYSITRLADWVGTSQPTATREINRAEGARIVTSRRVGKTRLVRADTANPLYRPYSEIVLATYGAPEVVRQEFEAVPGVSHLYLFGSFAARYMGEEGPAPNDLDVIVVGTPTRNEVYEAAERAEKRVGIPVNPTIRSEEEWRRSDDPFLKEIRSRALVSLGEEPER
jgi:DNA-binding transcriptional ArsR family regulator